MESAFVGSYRDLCSGLLRSVESPFPKCEGYLDFAQYRIEGTLICGLEAWKDRSHPPFSGGAREISLEWTR